MKIAAVCDTFTQSHELQAGSWKLWAGCCGLGVRGLEFLARGFRLRVAGWKMLAGSNQPDVAGWELRAGNCNHGMMS